MNGLTLALLALAAATQNRPAPDVRDAAYGDHPRHVIDLYKAMSDTPTPLVIYIHGGGFRAGSKKSVSPALVAGCLKEGISVAAIQYRLTDSAPYPAAMLDSARAVQFLRSKAKAWNLDPRRFAATGGSAGAGISMWLAFHDDLAKPDSDDPVARESTRLSSIAIFGGQCSYDPRWIRENIGGKAHLHPALYPFYGLKEGEDPLTAEGKFTLYEAASAINYLSKDDAPVWAFYSEPKGDLPENAKPGQGIHHPRFGVKLKEKMDPLGLACTLRHRDDYTGKGRDAMTSELIAFFKKHFGME